jgi:hypothetical protein
MSTWQQSRSKARLDHREQVDELVARARYEVRLHVNEPVAGTAYDNVADVFTLAHYECSHLLEHRRLLPKWEQLLLARYAKRLYGQAALSSVDDIPRDGGTELAGTQLANVFRTEIAALVPDSGDSGVRYDLRGRGLLTVFRLAIGQPGAVWPDREDVATASARNVLTCSGKFLKRAPWHVLWPVYRVRGVRLWKV